MAAQGTKVADVFIGIGGDLSAYRAELAKAPREAAGIASQIRTALSGGSVGRAGFGGFIEDLKLGGGLSLALRNNFKAMAVDLGRLSLGSLKSGLAEVQSLGSHVFGHLKTLAGEVFKGFLVGAGILGFLSLERVIEKITEAIPELINKGKEFAESIHTLTIETGATSEKASALLTIYQFLGGNATDLDRKVNRLSLTIHTNEAAFNALGIATRDANGNTLDQISIIDNLRHVFAELPEGPRKTELALRSFGRNGATALGPLLHYLNLTDEQVKQLTEDAEKQGNILSESQILTADAVGKAQARISNAYTGLANTLFAEVGPKLASFFDGIADFITANAQRIADAISGIVAQIVGLVQGLLGINLGSFSAQFSNIAEGGSQWAGALIDDSAALAKLEDQLHPTRTAVQDHNEAIDASVKGLEAESKAIDHQIDKLKRLGDVQDRIFRRQMENLTRQYDAELALLDAEDKRLARADEAEQDSRNQERATRDLAKAKRDLAGAQVDLANAQARYNEDLANPDADAHKQAQTIKQDILDIADAAQKVRDAQQGIADAQQGISDASEAVTDHARENAEADRREAIARTKEYVASIEKIVEESENKKAALKTLKNRQVVIEDQIAAAHARGDTAAEDLLKTKLAAILEGEAALTAKIKNQAGIDALTARKAELAKETEALRGAKQNETAINAAELQKQIADLRRKVAEDKRHLADEAAAHKKLQEEIDQGLITTAHTADTILDPAFERARQAGLTMAADIKKAIGQIVDVLLGSEGAASGAPGAPGGQTRTRSGGLVGALGAAAAAIGGIAGAVNDFTGGFKKITFGDIALVVAGAAALTGNFKLMAIALGAAGIISPAAAVSGGGSVIGLAAARLLGGLAGGVVGISTSVSGDVAEGDANATPGGYAPVAKANLAALIKRNTPSHIYNSSTGETDARAIVRLQSELASGQFSNRGYEKGGKIPGPSGTAVPILAHAGEYVLTEPETRVVEQARIAHSPSQTIREFVRTMLAKPAGHGDYLQMFQVGGSPPERRPTYEQGGLIPGPRGALVPILAQTGPVMLSTGMLDALRSLAQGPRFVGSGAAGGGFAGELHVHVNVPWDNRAVDFVSRELAYRRRT